MKSISKRTINKKIRNCFKEYTEDIEPTLIIDTLDKSFKTYGIRFIWIYDDKIKIDDIETSGYYLPDHKSKIRIIIAINENSKIFPLTEETIFDISTTIQHELIHHKQHTKRNNKFYEKINLKLLDDHSTLVELFRYFGTPDEVDAYAYNILWEMQFKVHSIDKTNLLKLLDISITWSLYNSYFPKFKKKLLKKIYKLIDRGIHWDK